MATQSQALSQAISLFTCKLSDASFLITILQSIALEKEQIAYISITELGLKIMTEKAKTLQAKAYLKKNLFTSWKLVENIMIMVPLQLLIQCLSLFDTATQLDLTLHREDSPLVLMLESSDIVTRCEVYTLNCDELPIDVAFSAKPVLNKVQLNVCDF